MILAILFTMRLSSAAEENCHGHTALLWDPHPDSTITHFEIERTVEGVDDWSVVGDTKEKNRPAFENRPAYRAETWDVLRAWSLPVEGVTYSYRVFAIRGTEKSPASNVLTCGPQDPTRCYPLPCSGVAATAKGTRAVIALLALLLVIGLVAFVVWKLRERKP